MGRWGGEVVRELKRGVRGVDGGEDQDEDEDGSES